MSVVEIIGTENRCKLCTVGEDEGRLFQIAFDDHLIASLSIDAVREYVVDTPVHNLARVMIKTVEQGNCTSFKTNRAYLVKNGELYRVDCLPGRLSDDFEVKRFENGWFLDVDFHDMTGSAWLASATMRRLLFDRQADQLEEWIYAELYSDTPRCQLCQQRTGTDYHDELDGHDVLNGHGNAFEHLCHECAVYEVEVCAICGEYHVRCDMHPVTSEATGNIRAYVCPQCLPRDVLADEYEYCDECLSFVPAKNWNEAAERCNDCERIICRDNLVKQCYYKPTPLFAHARDECHKGRPVKGVRYVGLEIEVDKGERNEFVEGCYDAAVDAGIDHLFYFKHDGSLRNDLGEVTGVEVTTVPIALGYALDGYPFDFIHEQAKKYHMKSHNTKTCGLHIHVNKDSISNFDLTMAKVLLIFDKFYPELCQFGRRISKAQARHWADRPRADINKVDDNELLHLKMENAGHNRYKAVNLSPAATVEFRLWKGTHNPDTLRATVDFTSAVLDVCTDKNLVELYDMVWGDFIRATIPYVKLEKTIEYVKHRNLLKEL